MTFVRPERQKNTDPRTNYAVKYATARGRPTIVRKLQRVPALRGFASKMAAWPKIRKRHPGLLQLVRLVSRQKYLPYHETSVAIPMSHCVSRGIADYRCYTPTSFLKQNGLSQLSRQKVWFPWVSKDTPKPDFIPGFSGDIPGAPESLRKNNSCPLNKK